MSKETIPGISLWQPFASLLATGSKTIETRSWGTSFRGAIAIHAAKRCVKAELDHYAAHWNFCAGLAPYGIVMGGEKGLDSLPFGAIVGIAEIVDCRPVESFTVAELDTRRKRTGITLKQFDEMARARSAGKVYSFPADDLLTYSEREFGDYSPGRFGWVFSNFMPLRAAVPCRGMQGIFDTGKTLAEIWDKSLELQGQKDKESVS